MPVKTILWPTDLSIHSRKAMAQVISLSEKYGAEVVVLYAPIDLCSYFPAYGNYPGTDMLNDFRDWEAGKARTTLEALCSQELKACPATRIRLVQGDPSTAILRTAEEEQADLIVMANRGLGSEQRGTVETGLGSIANIVVQTSPVPVHIIKV